MEGFRRVRGLQVGGGSERQSSSTAGSAAVTPPAEKSRNGHIRMPRGYMNIILKAAVKNRKSSSGEQTCCYCIMSH